MVSKKDLSDILNFQDCSKELKRLFWEDEADDPDDQVLEWHDEKLKFESAKCSVCFGIPFGNIYSCDNGHNICRRCIREVPGKDRKQCPVCIVWIPMSGPSRNYKMERAVRKGLFICPNGCREIHEGYEMFLHIEDDCKLRQVPCPLCYQMNPDTGVFYGVPAMDLIEHLNTHTAKFEDKQSHKFQKTLRLSSTQLFAGLQHLPPNMFKFDGHLFMINFRVQHVGFDEDMMLMWVQIMAGWEEATKYRSIIQLTGRKNYEISWDIPVTWVYGKRPWIGDSGSLTFDQLKGFATRFTLNPFEHTVFEFEPEVTMVKSNDTTVSNEVTQKVLASTEDADEDWD